MSVNINILGIVIKGEIEEDKVPHELFTYSAPIDKGNEESEEEAERIYKVYLESFKGVHKNLIKRYNADTGTYLFYVSIPNYYLSIPKEITDLSNKDQSKKILYKIYDVVELESESDRSRGKKLLDSMSEKLYDLKIYHDLTRKKVYIYTQYQEDEEN